MRTFSSFCSARSGFTLVEVLAAVVVAGVVMALAYPRTATMRQKANLRAAKQITQAYVRTARQAAVQRGTATSFVVAGNDISVRTLVNGVTTTIQPVVDLEERFGVTVGTSVTTVDYNPRGFARVVSAPATVRLTHGTAKDSLCVTTLGLLARCGL